MSAIPQKRSVAELARLAEVRTVDDGTTSAAFLRRVCSAVLAETRDAETRHARIADWRFLCAAMPKKTQEQRRVFVELDLWDDAHRGVGDMDVIVYDSLYSVAARLAHALTGEYPR